MFLGTASGGMTANTNKSAQITLDDLDRPDNCPESIELYQWATLVKLRRRKIASEEGIAVLVQQIAETEEVHETLTTCNGFLVT